MSSTAALSKKDRDAAAKQPVHEQVYQTLRDKVLFGDLTPGQAVTIQGLTDTLGVGMTPVREAIRRLISDGALRFQGNRRVSVPALTATDVKDLFFMRKAVESELAARAATKVSPDQIAALRAIDEALDKAMADGDVTGYLRHNYRFHAALFHYAEAPILTEIATRLWLRFGPSLRVVCGRFGTESLPDRHKDLLDALARADSAGAAQAITLDVQQGMQQISAVLRDPLSGGRFD